MSLYLAASYLLGGALGLLVAGALYDRFTAAGMDLSAQEASAYGCTRA